MMTPTYCYYRNKLLIACCILLSACSQTPTTTPTDQQVLAINRNIQQWQVSGKIGLRHGGNAESAYLNWDQCGEQYEIRLSGPLGQGAAKLYGNSNKAYLQTSDGQIFVADNPEQLLLQQFGWSLPLSPFKYWLRGLPSPTHPFQPVNNSNNFQQQQWQLNFLRFSHIDGHQLPTKLKAEHLAPQHFATGKSPLAVTLIIKNWQLQSSCKPLHPPL